MKKLLILTSILTLFSCQKEILNNENNSGNTENLSIVENFVDDEIFVKFTFKKDLTKNYNDYHGYDYKVKYFQTIADLYDYVEEYKKDYKKGGENQIDEIRIYPDDYFQRTDKVHSQHEINYTKESLTQIFKVLEQYPELKGNVALSIRIELYEGKYVDTEYVLNDPEIEKLTQDYLTYPEWLEKDKAYYPEHYKRQEHLEELDTTVKNILDKHNNLERSEESKKYLTNEIHIELGKFKFDNLASFYDFIPTYVEVIKDEVDLKVDYLLINTSLKSFSYDFVLNCDCENKEDLKNIYPDEILIQIFEILSLYPDMENSLHMIMPDYILQNPKIQNYIEKFSKK